MNAFIAPLERAVLNLAHGETDAEIKDSQRDRAVKGRPCRRQSWGPQEPAGQGPHTPDADFLDVRHQQALGLLVGFRRPGRGGGLLGIHLGQGLRLRAGRPGAGLWGPGGAE